MPNLDNDIKVSVCCAVFNHERYLRKCLDGFVMQKTNFKFEVLIHDDASTDSSADIIREYERKYPDIIKPIYQKENQYSQGVKISWTFQYPRAKGKYIAMCEGDDYWCDENKLQMQYDAMEAHSEVVMCTHKVEIINEDGSSQNAFFPQKEIGGKILQSSEMMEIMCEHKYPFQTSSYFYKKEYVAKLLQSSPDFMRLGGDLMLMLYLISKGAYIYIDKIMSCYRYQSLGSWTTQNKAQERQIALTKNTIAAYLLFDIYTNQIYSDIIKKIIEQQCFYIYMLTSDYKTLCNNQYRWIFKQQPIKRRIFYRVCACIPWIRKHILQSENIKRVLKRLE